MVRTTDRPRWRATTMALLALLLAAFAVSVVPARAQAPAPVALTRPATHIAHRSVFLEGTVTPGPQMTSYHFEYGPTTDYGSSTQGTVVSGAIPKDVSTPVSGLRAGTTYHYRLVASSPAGIILGEDMTVMTLTETAQPVDPAPAPSPKPATPSKPPHAARFHLSFTVTPEGLVLRQMYLRTQAPGSRFTVSCRRCLPRLFPTQNLSAVAGIRMPRGAVLVTQDRLHGYHGAELRLRLRNYPATQAAMARIAAHPFVRTTRELGVT